MWYVSPMSKTDTHRPWKVQISDSPREYHDHSKGGCDLIPLEKWMRLGRRQDWKYRCGWQPVNWHTDVTYSRYKDSWVGDSKTRKNKDWDDNYDY